MHGILFPVLGADTGHILSHYLNTKRVEVENWSPKQLIVEDTVADADRLNSN